MNPDKNMLNFVFGEDSRGPTPRERAASSRVQFVRSQDHLATYTEKASGHVLTAIEALDAFGFPKLLEAIDCGTAILPISPEEPALTLEQQREKLGVSVEDVARATTLTEQVITNAENPLVRSSIHDLERIAEVLGLDERTISVRRSDANAEGLAVRLKALGVQSAYLNAPHVLTLAEAAWVIATQTRLTAQLGCIHSDLGKFQPSDNYGDQNYPAWRHGYYLAEQSRSLLNLDEAEPIESMRLLVSKLRLPLIQARLPAGIAGATISSGGHRGIVVNTVGHNSSVWVRRATIAHELGHLLWDPEVRLESVRVDDYSALDERFWINSDHVEARANAFAFAFLAPVGAVEKLFKKHGEREAGIRAVMEHFGISFTAAVFHVWNACDREFEIASLGRIDSAPTDEWRGREAYTEDYFPLHETSQLRRGEFAGWVVAAERRRLISIHTAASYLQTTPSGYSSNAGLIGELFPVES
jgi:Zn-dependent peptidase ImmA (M78 family)/transcriptional regulator with XRE-family HTH domain